MSNTIIILTGLSPDEIVDVIKKLDNTNEKTIAEIVYEDTQRAEKEIHDRASYDDAPPPVSCIHGVRLNVPCIPCARMTRDDDP